MALSDLIAMSGTTVNVQIGITTQDASGGNLPSWLTQLAKVPAIIRPVSHRVQMQYAQRQISVSFSVLFAMNLTPLITGGITTNNRIVDTATGRIYKVEGFDPAPLLQSANDSFRVDCSLSASPS